MGVGKQLHCKVVGLGVFQERFFLGRELEEDFAGGLKIVPSARGKQVLYPEHPKDPDCPGDKESEEIGP